SNSAGRPQKKKCSGVKSGCRHPPSGSSFVPRFSSFLVPKLRLGMPDRETLFRRGAGGATYSRGRFAETEFRGRTFPNGVWERGHEDMRKPDSRPTLPASVLANPVQSFRMSKPPDPPGSCPTSLPPSEADVHAVVACAGLSVAASRGPGRAARLAP